MRPADGLEVVTFGCRLNGVESDAMAREAKAADHRNLTIVNTCAVTAEAVRQGRQAIRRRAALAPRGPDRGRPAARPRSKRRRFRSMPEVDLVVPNAAKTLPATWRALQLATVSGCPLLRFESPRRRTRAASSRCRTAATIAAPSASSRSGAAPRDPTPPMLWSRACGAHVEAGAREVVLTGVDVTAYVRCGGRAGARDRWCGAFSPKSPTCRGFACRRSTASRLDPVLIDCIATEPRLMPHLHLSIQSGSDLILKRMKRRHSRAEVMALCTEPSQPPARHRVRRRFHRRLSDRNRERLRRDARPDRGLRAHLHPCLPLFAAPRHARGAHAARCGCDREGAPHACARLGAGAASAASRPADRPPLERAQRTRRQGPRRGFHRASDCRADTAARPAASICATGHDGRALLRPLVRRKALCNHTPE